MVFTVFDRDCLLSAFQEATATNKELWVQKFKMNDPEYVNTKLSTVTGFSSIEEWDEQMTGLARSSISDPSTTTDTGKLIDKFVPHYADEILPFDVTLVFANEYGNRCALSIFGIEIINEGTGFSTDTVVTEKAYSYVARRVAPLESLGVDGTKNFASSW